MRLPRWLARARRDRERARELASYLEIETADNVARGMSPDDARDAARRKLGNLTRIREEIHDMNTIAWFDRLGQDVRLALRLMRTNAGFTVVAIASLALGIGANSAVFQLLDAVRLRSLPVQRPHEIVEVGIAGGNGGMGINRRYCQLTRPQWTELQRQQRALDLFAWSPTGARVGRDRRAVPAIAVSSGYFQVLGLQAARGRFFSAADDAAPCPTTRVVVSHDFWQRELGGRELSDAALTVNDTPHEVIGVAPAGFRGLIVGDRFDVAFPLCRRADERRDVFDLVVMGRLKDGWTPGRTTEHLRGLSAGIQTATALIDSTESTSQQYRNFTLEAIPSPTGLSELRRTYDTSLWLLLAITGLVLLIACANLANLLLARAAAREREFAVRLAIGASRGRLIGQLLTESALLAVAGAVLAVGVSTVFSRALVAALSSEMRQVTLPLTTDWRVFAFAAAMGAATSLLFGTLPAIRAARAAPADAMKNGGRGSTDGRDRHTLQRLLVVGQIAVSLVLVVGALLFVRSFYQLTTFDAGIRQTGIAIAFAGLDSMDVPEARRRPFAAELLEEVKRLPGVENAAATTHVPLAGGRWGHGVKAGSADVSTTFTWVSPEYFATMDLPLVAGRRFDARDTASSPRVAIVNQAFLRTFFPGHPQPIGQTLMQYGEPDYPETVYEIVGVVPDAQYNDLRTPAEPAALVPMTQFPAPVHGVTVLVRAADADATLASVRRHLTRAYPKMQIEGLVLRRLVEATLVRERLMAMLSGFFGVLAALLASIGLYGVIAYVMQRRRNEVGIRLALGARPGQVVRMVLVEATVLVAGGVSVGAVLAVLAGRGSESLLFGLSPTDVTTFVIAAALLAAVALLASAIPALRASRVDPMLALRQD
jgi:predicted permease